MHLEDTVEKVINVHLSIVLLKPNAEKHHQDQYANADQDLLMFHVNMDVHKVVSVVLSLMNVVKTSMIVHLTLIVSIPQNHSLADVKTDSEMILQIASHVQDVCAIKQLMYHHHQNVTSMIQ